ncbi:MAG: tripartite tricarboxylate transporter substrate binding protein [Pseudolabrys sp.]
MALAAALVAAAPPAQSQTYPSGPVHMIVGYAPGGTGDVVARIVASKLSEALGQSVIVENRAGASGAIAAHGVATAPPDGLMLLVGQTAEVAINQHWLKGLTYDPDKDLKPVALLAIVPLALTVPAKAPYSTMPEFLKALPGQKMTFASAGTGTPGHFAGEFLKAKTKANLVHVPYKGAGPALNDLARQPRRSVFPRHAGGDCRMRSRHAQGACCLVRKAFGDCARSADDCRDHRHDGLRLHALGRRVCAARDAASSDREAQYRNQQGAERSRHQEAAGRSRRRSRHHVGGAVPRFRRS